ncbi:type II toxin-antitoxin system RelE/ParE family toxin [Longimicrobium sp.]|uniref:type II toxin-antitoxin system RelE/ParE family toxin n=1 Tax=Longimicrobium sp. TaxID=2029185 RepID=UPI002E353886|nr:type II toxin-antitoxin system RelE/ParE family toxin [Longimicrobium sp.]HEX6039181.1 type II toxin-antitoxin system RelE/ParE family toxin [Longimicrobium sp.]
MSDRIEIVPTPWYTAEVRALPREDRDRIDRRLETFTGKGWGPAQRDATLKHLRDGIYELRVLGTGAAYRVLFFVMLGRSPRVVVLTTCVAKSVMKKRHRMDSEIDRASSRRAEWLEDQKKGEDDERQ